MKTLHGPLFDHLTTNEKKLFLALTKVPDNTLWGVAISNVIERPTLTRFRDLKSQLKSQAKDNPSLMETIIGKEAFTNLKSK